jgi:hypothetical protein
MLKHARMISLYFLAAAICEPSLNVPPHVLLNGAPVEHVTVSAYTNHPRCTAADPNKTASSLRIGPEHYGRLIALSRDLAKNHVYGDEFNLWVKGKLHQVTYQDRMPAKHKKKVDLLLPSLGACRQFGRQPGVIFPLDKA